MLDAKRPTKSQVAAFWAHYGFKRVYGERGWEYFDDKGLLVVDCGNSPLEINLNNLYVYIVPRYWLCELISDGPSGGTVTYKALVIGSRGNNRTGKEAFYDPALALYYGFCAVEEL